MKPKVYRSPARGWMWVWSCECSPGVADGTKDSHSAAFSDADRHARSLQHQLRVALLDWARMSGRSRR